MSSQGKAGPSVFYILTVTRNPRPALNFPVKYTTFHVTHTNPAAISLSLNRAESLYLNSLAEFSAAEVGIAVTGWLGQKVEATELCLSLTLSAAWPHSTLLHFVFKQGSIWLYCTLLDYQTASGLQRQPANTSHKKHRACTRPQHIHRHLTTQSVNSTQTPALQPCLLTAARPPQSSCEVKICYIMQPSIDFPPLAPCQLPAPKSKI